MEIVKIDLVPSGVMPSCHASQYDIGREIRFLLTDGGEEYTLAGTETISIELRKPDGTSETIAIPNTSSNYVDWETSDGELDLSGVYLAEISIKNGDDVLGSANFIVKTEADAYDGADVRTVTVGPADICTFETNLPEPLQSVIVDVVASGGNGTPDNPNPIVGYSSANITRCGKNLFNVDIATLRLLDYTNNIFSNTDADTRDYINLQIETRLNNAVVFRHTNVDINTDGLYQYVITTSGVFDTLRIKCNGRIKSFWLDFPFTKQGTFTISLNVLSANPTVVGGVSFKDVQIEVGNTASDYAPYNGQTYTVNFGQTVYGGQLDVTRGKLHVTHGKYTLDNTATAGQFDINTYADRNRLSYVPYQSDGKTNGTFKADKLETILNAPGGIGTGDYQIFGSTTAPRMWITVPTTIATVADFLTYISSNPIDVVYELATPFDIDLTPEVIEAIVGENNVFADCGQTTVKYLTVE